MIHLDAQTPETLSRQIAQRERQRRRERHLTQAEMTERSGVSLGSLKRFEQTGQISLDSLLRLAAVLGCSSDFDDLFKQPEYTSIQEVIDDAERNRKANQR